MALKNPTNQPMEDVEVPDSEDDGQEHDNTVQTPRSRPRCSQPPPQKKLELSEDEESEDDESEEDESKEESDDDDDDEEEEEEEEKAEEEQEDQEETEGESGEDKKQASPIQAPTQIKGGGVSETNLTIMTNSAARKEERDDLDQRKMETELRIEYLDIFLEFTELHKRMALLKRKARHHNMKIEDEEGDGCLLPSKKSCYWCNMLKHIP